VDVQSEPGKGTQFKVYLPATDAAEVREGAARGDIPKGNGQCVLVVDDEESIVDLIQATLRGRNYRVRTAKDGTEALAVYMKHKNEIDIVLIDLLMPYLDGPSTVRTMRKFDPDVKIIAMSGLLVDKAKRDEVLASDTMPFLQKPFSVENLLTTLYEALQSSDLAEAV